MFFHSKTDALPVNGHCCYTRRMVDAKKGKKAHGTKDRLVASSKDEQPKRTDGEDEGNLTAVKPKVGEPAGNLRRRAEWFQKRH